MEVGSFHLKRRKKNIKNRKMSTSQKKRVKVTFNNQMMNKRKLSSTKINHWKEAVSRWRTGICQRKRIARKRRREIRKKSGYDSLLMTRHLNHRDKMNSFLMKMILICSNQMSWKQKKRKEHFRTLKNITTWKQLGELEITWRKLRSYLTKRSTLTMTINLRIILKMDHSRSLVMVCFRNFMTSIRYNAKLIRKKIWLFRFLIVEGDTTKSLNSFGM